MPTEAALQNIEGALQQLRKLRKRLSEEKGLSEEEAARSVKVMGILEFAEDGCELAKKAVELNAWPYEFVLVRPMMESAVRLIYATRAQNGWARYLCYWVQQDIERVQNMIETAPKGADVEPLKEKLAELEAEKLKLNVEPMPYKLPSIIKAVLSIEADPKAPPKTPEDKDREGETLTALLFKLSHTYSHAHPDYLESNLQAKRGQVAVTTFYGMLFIQAAFLFTLGVYSLRGWPNAQEDGNEFVRQLPNLPA